MGLAITRGVVILALGGGGPKKNDKKSVCGERGVKYFLKFKGLAHSFFERFCRFLGGGAGALIIALLSVMGAALISIYSSKIVAQIDYLLFSGEETTLHELTLSLGVSVVAVFFVMFRELGLAQYARAKERQLEKQSLEMERRLTNLPPKSFLALYANSIKDAGQLRNMTKAQLTAQSVSFVEVSKRVRILMNTVLSLARSWDGVSKENKSMVYKSNIMMSIPASSLRKHALGKTDMSMDVVMKSNFFLHNQNSDSIIDRCDGVLILADNQYSTSSVNEDDEPDLDIKPICFPYSFCAPGEAVNPDNHPNLPGAPEAMATGEAQYMGDTSRTMKAWLDSIGDSNGLINRQYREKIYDYYRERYEAQSILAIPIKLNGKIFAILNIYRNNTEILLNESRSEQFVTLLEPVCYQLAKMLLLASRSKASEDKKRGLV
ncbi:MULTISPECIES: GAF domain-containing protein [Pseudomonas]|uniref:GAF domain-containing protein n=1 Tax=Pseudomonas TaxID=286 RepID=UPI000CD5249A|nr:MULTISPECIES: GAF domain-containing protein [Pseudomonas]RBH52716.1 hypothetical protein C3F00_031010 [Pseudomonas sp. MWU13-2860]